MKKMISLVLALSLLFCFSIRVFAVEEEEGYQHPVRTWLLPGEEWLCEEHYVIKHSDYPYAVCPQCYRRYGVSLYSASNSSLPAGAIEWDITGAYYGGYWNEAVAASLNADGFYVGGQPSDYPPGYFFYWKFDRIFVPADMWMYIQVKVISSGSVVDLSGISRFSVFGQSFGQFNDCNLSDCEVQSDGSIIFPVYCHNFGNLASSQSGFYMWFEDITPYDVSTILVKPLYYVEGTADKPPVDPGGGGDDPDPGPMNPPTDSDKWMDEQYGSAAGTAPELGGKIDSAQSDISAIEDFDSSMFAGLDDNNIDPGSVSFPLAFVSALSFISSTFVDVFNGLGDFQFVFTFPMFLGLALIVLGRVGQAIATERGAPRKNADKTDGGSS